jgi:hypothetical protein
VRAACYGWLHRSQPWLPASLPTLPHCAGL